MIHAHEIIHRALFQAGVYGVDTKAADAALEALTGAVTEDALQSEIVRYVGATEPHTESFGLARHLSAVIADASIASAALPGVGGGEG